MPSRMSNNVVNALQTFFSHPVVGIIVTILALVAGWKMTGFGANWLLVVAWVIGVAYVFFTGPLPHQATIPRILWTDLFAAGFGLLIYYALWTLPPTPSVSPRSFQLRSGDWDAQMTVSVTNPTDAPVYGLMLKMVVEGSGVPADSVEIKADKQQPPVELSMGDVIASADGIRMNCTADDGREVILFTLHTVRSKETRTLQVKGSAKTNAVLNLSIASFSKGPQRLLAKDNDKIAVPFTAPGNMVVHQIVVSMRKREEPLKPP